MLHAKARPENKKNKNERENCLADDGVAIHTQIYEHERFPKETTACTTRNRDYFHYCCCFEQIYKR